MNLVKVQLVNLLFITFLFLQSAAAELKATDKPSFNKKTLSINNIKITAEIADTYERKSFGLMYRTHLEKNHGMLFIYDKEQIMSFWMKNTLIPLSIGFFNKSFILVDIQEMQNQKSIMQEVNTYQSKVEAQYALEMNANWFSENQIKVGSKLIILD